MDEAWTLQDLIGLLAERVRDLGDFIRCATVCEVWKCSFKEYKPHELVPRMMFVEREDSDIRDFYDYFDGDSLSFSLPEVHGRWFFATNYGWVLTLGLDSEIHLLHPVSKERIRLPGVDKFTHDLSIMLDDKQWIRSKFIEKVCLSSDPRKKNCVVMVTYSGLGDVSFVRLGDSSWTNVELPVPCFNDLMFYEGKFYAIRNGGLLVTCDIDSSMPKAVVIINEFPKRSDGKSWTCSYPVYLVESFGHIFAVVRVISTQWGEYIVNPGNIKKTHITDYHTVSFHVYKLEKNGENEEMKWSRVNDLGNCALFLGRNSSMSVATKNDNGIRRNCIYFTDDSRRYCPGIHSKKCYDQGIFSLDNRKAENCFVSDSFSSYSSPGWILFSSFNL